MEELIKKEETAVKDFSVLEKIGSLPRCFLNSVSGSGSFSVVFKVKRQSDEQIYAMKKMSIHKLSEREKNCALAEIRIISSIRDPNIILFKECFVTPETGHL